MSNNKQNKMSNNKQKPQKLLFICDSNLQRSPTAEELLKNSNYEVKSCGIHPLSKSVITRQALEWADLIFVMELFQKNYILKNFPEAKNKNITILDIPDIYFKNDPKLISILKEKLKKYIKI